MATVNGCFLLFSYNNQIHRAAKDQSTRPQKTGALNTCTLTLFSAKYVF